MRRVVNLGLSVLLLWGLQACSLTGKGEWSDSEGNSGSLKSKMRLEYQMGRIVYKLKFGDGVKEVFKLYGKKGGLPASDDNDTGIYNAQGEQIGTAEENEEGEKPLVFEIDGKQVEILLQKGDHNDDMTMPVTGSITYPDGRVLTWKDELTIDRPEGVDR